MNFDFVFVMDSHMELCLNKAVNWRGFSLGWNAKAAF